MEMILEMKLEKKSIDLRFVTFLHEFLPIVDDRNKQRKSVLILERKWFNMNYYF